jgi:hypothetical protein
MPLWPLEWRCSAPQTSRRLSPRRLTRHSPGASLKGKPGMLSSPFAWSQGGPVGFERMIDMWCRWGEAGDLSWTDFATHCLALLNCQRKYFGLPNHFQSNRSNLRCLSSGTDRSRCFSLFVDQLTSFLKLLRGEGERPATLSQSTGPWQY